MKKVNASILFSVFSFVFTLATTLSSQSLEAAATIQARDRVLVLLTDLDTHGVSELRPLYSVLEDLSIALPNSPFIRGQYQRIITLRNERATPSEMRKLFFRLASDDSVKAIDFFLMVHGSPGELSFFDGRYNMADFVLELTRTETRAEVFQKIQMKKKLRLAYNTSCFGASHRRALLDIGFESVVGSVGVNANSEAEYPSFLSGWVEGKTVEQALANTNNPVALLITDGPLVTAGRALDNFLKHVNSKKLITSNQPIKINTNPAP